MVRTDYYIKQKNGLYAWVCIGIITSFLFIIVADLTFVSILLLVASIISFTAYTINSRKESNNEYYKQTVVDVKVSKEEFERWKKSQKK